MELSLIDFEYNFDKRIFYNISYSFDTKITEFNSKSFKYAASLFADIEKRIDDAFIKRQTAVFNKRKLDRIITANSISYGNYYQRGEDPFAIAFLKNSIDYSSKQPMIMFTVLSQGNFNEEDSLEMMNLYKHMMKNPTFSFSENARVNRDRINYIIGGEKFNTEQFLFI